MEADEAKPDMVQFEASDMKFSDSQNWMASPQIFMIIGKGTPKIDTK